MGNPARAYLNALYTPPAGGGGGAAPPPPAGIAPQPPVSPVAAAPGAPVAAAPGGMAPAGGSNPVANSPVIDFGPTAGLVYKDSKFFDPATGQQVDPKTYSAPAAVAQPAAAAPAPSAPVAAAVQAPVAPVGIAPTAQLQVGGGGWASEREERARSGRLSIGNQLA
jgi:DNA polymerase-3 subunit gamma/tau